VESNGGIRCREKLDLDYDKIVILHGNEFEIRVYVSSAKIKSARSRPEREKIMQRDRQSGTYKSLIIAGSLITAD